MVVGVFIMGMGIAISKLALLGTTPISTIPAVMSYATDLTIGTWTIIINVFLILIIFLIRGRKFFSPLVVLQMAVAILLGLFTDLGVEIFKGVINTDFYPMQWVFCVLACVVLSFGVTIAVSTETLVAPGDGVVIAVTMRYPKWTFSRFKVIFDSTNVILAAVISLALMGGFYGVREGTVFAAVAVGLMVGFWKKHITAGLNRIFE